jgi:hypothetical protein
MFNFNLITGPLFTAGLLNGLNERAEPNFQPDPRAHYKIMGMAVGAATLMGLNNYFQEHHSHIKSRFSAHVVGGAGAGLIASGRAYCIGLMLTKIPSKTVFE